MTLALHGSYYGYNFGDTLLCRIFCDWTRAAAPDRRVVLPLANARNTALIGADGHGPVSALAARRLMFVGGGYFSEAATRPAAWSRRAYLRHVGLGEAAAALGRPYGVFGVGAGPIRTPWLARRVARLCEGAQCLIVRDPESADFLHSVGVTREIQVWADAALSTPFVPDAVRADRPPTLMVHISAQPSASEIAVATAAVRWGLAQKDVQLVLADDGLARRRRSVWAAQILANAPNEPRLRHVPYDGDPSHMLDLIRSVDAVVTTKLHMGIVSLTQRRHVVSFPAHSKTVRFYRQVGLSGQCVPIADFEEARLSGRLNAWRAGEALDMGQFDRLRSAYDYEGALRRFVGP